MRSGIYVITNKATNKHYIGQTVSLKRRIREHKYALQCNKHHNKHLQNSWNKYGKENFLFSVLEVCPSEDLTAREIEWVSFFKVNGVYNIEAIETPMLGLKHSEEAKQKMRRTMSIETKQKISLALKGKKHSLEHAKATGKNKCKRVLLVSTNQLFESISEAAKFLNVHPFNLGKHLNGKTKTCKGKVLKFA